MVEPLHEKMSAFQETVIEGTANALIRIFTWGSSWFTAHPAEHGMTYGGHARRALWMSGKMGWGAVALVIHAVFPFWFKTTGSRTVRELAQEIVSYQPARARAISTSTSCQCRFSPARSCSEADRSMPAEGNGA